MSHRETPTPSTEAYFNATVTPCSALIKPQHNFVVWQNMITVTMRDVWLQHFTLRVQGTIGRSCLQFFRFYLDGKQYGRPIPALTDDFVYFDFSWQPVQFETGNRVMRVRADILEGRGNFQFLLQDSTDFSFLDVDWLPIIPGVGQEEFRKLATGLQEVG